MNRILFKVLINGVTIGQDMELEHAMIFVEGLFDHYYNEEDMTISIQRMERVTTGNDTGIIHETC